MPGTPTRKTTGRTAGTAGKGGRNTANKAVRNNKWFLNKTFGLILPELQMLSNERLGLLTKAALEGIVGRKAVEHFPTEMDIMLTRLEEGLHYKPDGIVPLWAYLYTRSKMSAPVVFAMSNEAAGGMIRCYTATILGQQPIGFPASLPESHAVSAHITDIYAWMNEMPNEAIQGAYRNAAKMVTKFSEVLDMTDEEQEAAHHVIGARLAKAPDVACTNCETVLANIAEDVCSNGEEYSAEEIQQMYAQAAMDDESGVVYADDEEALGDEQEDELEEDVDEEEYDEPDDAPFLGY